MSVKEMIKVSVIIPTYNRLDRLRRVLERFENQTYSVDDFEIVVVSDGSSDGTHEFLRSYQPAFSFVPVIQENQGPAAARNNGYRIAKGEYILFVDDDVFPVENLIDEHMRFHEIHENTVVIGPMLTPDDFDMPSWVLWEQYILTRDYAAMEQGLFSPTARQFYTGNTSLARCQLEKTGGFDESFRRAEDLELAYRLADQGLNFEFNPKAIGYHYAERSLESWMKTAYVYGSSDVKFGLEKNQLWLLRTLYDEYQERHIFTRTLCNLCLDHKLMTNIVVKSLPRIAAFCYSLKLKKLTRITYSGLFNLRYYQGFTDELGGREKFYNRAYV